METSGIESQPDHDGEADVSFESSPADEFALLLAKAVQVWERTVEITELAKIAAAQAKQVKSLEDKLGTAKVADQPVELLLAEYEAASEQKLEYLERLIQIIWPDLFYLAYKCSKSFAEAKDTAQEAAIHITKGIHKFSDQGGGFRPWYATVTSRTSTGRYRWWTRWTKRGQRWQESEELTAAVETASDNADTATKLFHEALSQLSQECRERFKHLKAAGTKLGGHAEIAQRLAENLDASKKRTHVCVKQFRTAYQSLSEAHTH